jgi:hypothetical protein
VVVKKNVQTNVNYRTDPFCFFIVPGVGLYWLSDVLLDPSSELALQSLTHRLVIKMQPTVRGGPFN